MFFGAGELWDFPATFDYSTRGYIMVCIYIYIHIIHTHTWMWVKMEDLGDHRC